MNSKYKIYSLNDPNSGDIRYVGKTNQKLSYRLNQHLVEAVKSTSRTLKIDWIRYLISQKQCPTIHIIEETSSPIEREIYWIAKLRSEGVPLTNMTDGGDGNSNQHRKPESYVIVANKLKGVPRPQYVRDKISKSHMGKVLSEFTKQKLRYSNLGKHPSVETRSKQWRSVDKLDKDGIVMQTYLSLTEAAIQNSCSKGAISNACKGIAKTAGGFKWRYTDYKI